MCIIYGTFFAIVLRGYNRVFLCYCWFLFFSMMDLMITNMSPFYKKSIESLILRWPLRLVGLFFSLYFLKIRGNGGFKPITSTPQWIRKQNVFNLDPFYSICNNAPRSISVLPFTSTCTCKNGEVPCAPQPTELYNGEIRSYDEFRINVIMEQQWSNHWTRRGNIIICVLNLDVVNAQVQASKLPDKLLYKYKYGEGRLNILGSN